VGVVTELEQRVLDAVAGQNVGTEAPEGVTHGTAGAMRWLVDSDGHGGAPRWEGGYVCWCGQVFARPAVDGGMRVALEAFIAHAEVSA
jgi:hypothetical protein